MWWRPDECRRFSVAARFTNTRGIQNVRRLTQLAIRDYTHHILSLFNIVSCNWNALGPAFLQSSDSDIEELLFLVFQSAICHAIRIRMANMVGDGVVQSRHFLLQRNQSFRETLDKVHFRCRRIMLKSDKIWCAYLVANCVSLRTLWTPLV